MYENDPWGNGAEAGAARDNPRPPEPWQEGVTKEAAKDRPVSTWEGGLDRAALVANPSSETWKKYTTPTNPVNYLPQSAQHSAGSRGFAGEYEEE